MNRRAYTRMPSPSMVAVASLVRCSVLRCGSPRATLLGG
jgi:hypothetical protein